MRVRGFEPHTWQLSCDDFQCESLYIVGVQLLLLDKHFPGSLRELILVSNHRFGGSVNQLEEVCKFARANGKQQGRAEGLFE